MERNNGLIAKWGNELFDDGITNIPQCFARYGRRFVTAGEFSFIVGVFSFQYTADLPFPSQELLAENMDVQVRQIRKWIKSLEDKGLIEVFFRYEHGVRTSNEYSFKPLIDKCLELSISERMGKEKEKKTLRVKKKSTTGTSGSGSQLKVPEVPVVRGPQVPVVGGPQVPVVGGPQVPTNKEVFNKELEERNINNVCVEDESYNSLLQLIESREDLTTHKQKIISIYNKKKKNKNFNASVFIQTLEIIDLDIKPFKYLETALMNNLKRGFVEEFNSKKQQSNRTEVIPDWFPESQQTLNNNVIQLDIESAEQKRQRLKKIQDGYKK